MIKFNDLLANHAKMMLWRGRAQAFKRSMNILLGNKEEDRWEDRGNSQNGTDVRSGRHGESL